ncbi:MAG: oligosaccharide flippase family protein [Pseudomonadota bacterium]
MPPKSKSRRAASHIGLYSIGTIVRQVVGFLMLPIYTRYLSPADYGIVAMLTLMLSVFELVVGARFAQAIPKFYYEHDEQARRFAVVATALFVTVAMSAVGSLAIYGFAESLAEIFLADQTLWLFVAAFGLTLMTTAMENYGLIFMRLRDKPVLFLAFSLAKLFCSLVLNIYLVVILEMGVAGVVISTVGVSLLFALLASGYILSRTGFHFEMPTAKRLLIFSWPLWVAGSAGVYSSFVNRFLLRYFGDLAEVGLYDLAGRFAALIGVLVWLPFNQWWQTERFSLLRNDDGGKPVFRAVFTLISAMLVFVCCGISLFADVVIKIMAAPEFYPASQAVPALTFAVAFERMSTFQNFSFFVSEKTKFVAVIKYASAFGLSIAYFAAIPVFGFVGAAYATLTVAIAIFGLTNYLAIRAFDTSIRVIRVGKFVVIGAIVSIGGNYLLSSLPLVTSLLLKSALMLVTGALFYLVLRSNAETREKFLELERFVMRKIRSRNA